MPIGFDLDSLFTVLTSVASGAVGGGIWQNIVGDYLKRKELDRSESKEAKGVCLNILPLLYEIEHTYKVDAAEFIDQWDIVNNIRDDEIPKIKIRPFDKKFSAEIAASNLRVLDGDIAVSISLLEREIDAINKELNSYQSPGYFDYVEPGVIAIKSKEHAEIRLTEFLIRLNKLRELIIITYLGKKSWTSRELRGRKQLMAMHKKAKIDKSLRNRMRLYFINKKIKFYTKLALWRAR